MAKLDLLRKMIREEVRAVFQAELAGILKEAITANKQSSVFVESKKATKPTIPGTLNTQARKPVVVPNLGSNNPLTNLLAETAQSMLAEDAHNLSFTTADIPGFNMEQVHTDIPVVDSVNDMLATSRASTNFDAVQISTVPDFTQLMSKLKANGSI